MNDFILPDQVQNFIETHTLRWEGGYASTEFDGLHTFIGIQNDTLTKYYPENFPDSESAIAYIENIASIAGKNATLPPPEVLEELKSTNPEFREFIELKEDIILKDHVINADLQYVHTQALGPMIDTSFHRGPEMA